MKKIFYLSVILIFLSIETSYGQNYDSSKIKCFSEDVIKFFNNVDYFCSFYSDTMGWEKNFSFEEIKNLSDEYYNVIYNHYTEYYFYLKMLHKNWGNNLKKYKKIIDKKPGVKLGIIRRKIAEYYSPSYSELLTIPYLLRVKVLQFDESFYYPEDENLKNVLKNGRLKQTDMVVKIIDIIKGQNHFNVNDTIVISFFWAWFSECYNHRKFEVDQSYFIPIGIFRVENINKYQYSIKMLSDNNCTVYPIDSEIVKTPGDFFNTGEENTWKTFKESLIKNYIIK